MARGVLLLKRPSPFAFPGGNPGFDPSHVASAPVPPARMFSGVATSSGFIDLTTGKPGTPYGTTASAVIDGGIGPSSNIFNGSDGWNFAGKATTVDLLATQAGIIRIPSFSSFNCVFSNTLGGSAGGWEIRIISNGNLTANINGGSNVTNNVILTPNVPYFVAVSLIDGVSLNYIAANFNTGEIQSDTQPWSGVTLASGGPLSGTYVVGNVVGTINLSGYISAAMYMPRYLSQQQLLQWAKDPWSFWYP